MGFVHQHIESLVSTNETLWELSEKVDLQHFHTISADYQYKGKGKGENTWESALGKNMLFSTLIFPEFLGASNAFQISRWVSLSIVDYLKSKGITKLKIKWPNDIYVGDKKIAGILIQNSIMGSYISKSMFGIGLNLNQYIFESDAPNPISLVHLKPANYDVLFETHTLLEVLQFNYNLLQSNAQKILDDYHYLLYRLEEWKSYETILGSIEGKIVGVDDYGRLKILDRSDQLHAFNMSEVKFL